MTKALVVDDDPILAEIVGRVVDRAGYRAVVVNTMLEAVRIIKEPDPPDIVITDYHLSGGPHGLALIEILRVHKPDLIAILATANASPEVLTAAEAAGAGYIVKPFLVADVKQAIKKALVEQRAIKGEI